MEMAGTHSEALVEKKLERWMEAQLTKKNNAIQALMDGSENDDVVSSNVNVFQWLIG